MLQDMSQMIMSDINRYTYIYIYIQTCKNMWWTTTSKGPE